jgi:SAM-dependent methyltransferase
MVEPSTLAGGTYARKQIFSRSRLVAWSHGSRFDMARRLVSPCAGGRLLDYGCGDGTFAAMVHADFASTVATDVDTGQLADCARRFRHLPGLAFIPLAAVLDDGREGGPARFDAVTCMEVLEHCVDDARRRVLEDLRRLVAPTGRVIISVPIESGLSLVAKQLVRRLAGWRNLGDYRFSERYSWSEMARLVFGGSRASIERPVYRGRSGQDEYAYHGHKGFNWRALEAEVRVLFDVEVRRYSPMPALGSFLNSQVWLVCRPR